MKISVIQTDLVWENKPLNLVNIARQIMPLFGKTDLVIMPEMFNSGFSMNPEKLSESAEDKTFTWMKNISETGNLGLCGSYIIKDQMSFFNRFVFVAPGEKTLYYDKRHLFSIGGENRIFTPGRKRLVFSFRGFRISPYICYDLRFPVWSRNRNDCDLMIYSANWPASRIEVWNTLLRARAMENQCYVAGSNRIGTDGAGVNYSGGSVIIDPMGSVLDSAKKDEEMVITCEISLSELSDLRKKFPVCNDADNFTIEE